MRKCRKRQGSDTASDKEATPRNVASDRKGGQKWHVALEAATEAIYPRDVLRDTSTAGCAPGGRSANRRLRKMKERSPLEEFFDLILKVELIIALGFTNVLLFYLLYQVNRFEQVLHQLLGR